MLDDFEITNEMLKQQDLVETIKTLELVNYQIAELARIKEELEARACALLEHGDEGQKTYTCGKWKVTAVTGYNYSVNKDEYEAIKGFIPGCFNPVKIKTSYEVDKKILQELAAYGSADDVAKVNKFLSAKPKKLYVKISAGV